MHDDFSKSCSLFAKVANASLNCLTRYGLKTARFGKVLTDCYSVSMYKI
jgi:hypothetical protein